MRVALRDIVGSTLTLEVDPLCTVRALKEKVASSWQMPALCQTLLMDKVVLEDEEELLCYCQGGSNAVELLVVVSYQKAYDSLASGCTKTKLAAMSAVAHMGATGDERMLTKLNDLFDDEHMAVRHEAAHTVSRLAPLGHELAISLMQRRLSSPQPDIVITAMGVISRVARHCAGEEVRLHVAQLAAHESPQLRDAALRTLASIVRPGDSASVQCLQRGMEDPDRLVRVAAVRALSTLAVAELGEMTVDKLEGNWGPQTAFSALHAALAHSDGWVRQCTLELMPELVAACSVEPTRLVSTIFGCATDQAEEVRIAALRAASEIGLKRQNERLLAVVTSRSRDTSAAVRQAVVSVATDLAHAGVLPAVGLLSALFGDTDSLVRRSAVEALAEVAEAACGDCGDPEFRAVAEAARFHAIVAGVAGVKDDATIVRLAAGAVLARLDIVGRHHGRDVGSIAARLEMATKPGTGTNKGLPALHRHYSKSEIAEAFTRLSGRKPKAGEAIDPMQHLHEAMDDLDQMVGLAGDSGTESDDDFDSAYGYEDNEVGLNVK